MKISLDRSRFKIYLRIGAYYLLLSAFGDLVSNQREFLKTIWNHTWLISYLVVLNYIFYESVLPYMKVTWRRILILPIILFALLMVCSFGFYAWRSLGAGLHLYFPMEEHKSVLAGVERHVGQSLFSLFFFGIGRHIYDYRKLRETTQQLRIEKQQAELNYLKSQTNPHFLFNTLNNIYSLARDKSNLAPESILRLSKILRFMLYETAGEYIAIEQELKVMDDYIALEKLRYDESLRINVSHDLEDMKQAIPPLLLIPLVENAFKHGVSESRSRPFVDVHLSVKNRHLLFVVKNSAETFLAETRVKENIGLANLRRQLELLYTDYNLSLKHKESVFSAILKINLSSHV